MQFFQQRSRARSFAIQALYEWQISQSAIADIMQNFAQNPQFSKASSEYFTQLLQRITEESKAYDALIEPFLNRPIEQIDPIERAVLWLGTYELKEQIDIPYKVAINEAVELTKTFGSEGSHRFINGILDKVRKALDRKD